MALATMVLGACGAPSPPERPGTRRGASRQLQVVTTILPVTLFTRAVAGDCAEVTPLIPAGSAAHSFQARPADLLTLRRARVLVINGLGMESFLNRLINAAENPTLQVIDASHGITPLLLAPGQPTGGHGHGHGQENGAAASGGAAPGAAAGSAGGPAGPASVNPHVWLDPQRAALQVATIRDGLIRADPHCAAGYRHRAATMIGRLQELDREIDAQLEPFRGRSFVAFHDVAPYFAQRYGLRASFLVDVPEVNPTPRDLRRVAALVQRSQLRALLSEPQQGERSFNALARDLGVRLSPFDPLESADAGASLDPDTYFTVMRRNTADLLEAFGGARRP
ncbi:MAG: metal ABC transporter solute-binding protein, Zn/Mn family [Cyanobium sp.]